MALGSQVNHAVDLKGFKNRLNDIEVANIRLHKPVIGLSFQILQIGEVAGIGQLIKVNNLIAGILIDKQSHYMGADEAGTSCD
jgi:hypothetical protein